MIAPAMPQPTAPVDLARVRRQIDQVDRRILALFARRVRLSLRAGAAKAARGLPVQDPARETEVLARARAYACARKLDPVTFAYAMDAVIELCALAQIDADAMASVRFIASETRERP